MIKKMLHSLAWNTERILDGLRGQRDTRRIIEPYIGYATPDHLVVRGRVLSGLRRNKPVPTQSRWTNFKQMLSLFLTDEVAAVKVAAHDVTGLTDEEGYFTLLLPRTSELGWNDVEVTIEGRAGATLCPVLVADAQADFAIVSDIDDTMLKTGAYSLVRNLWTTFTGNAGTRSIFPDAVAFIQEVSRKGRNPVYYVSSSPWNLHQFLQNIFAAAGLVKGPTFLRDLGISKTQFITGTHGDHKGSSIDALMMANPKLRYVLVGDTGQHDAFVYRDAIARHPGRVMAIVLREPGPGPDAQSLTALEEIRQSGVPVLHGTDFSGFASRVNDLAAQGISGMRPSSESVQHARPSRTIAASG